MRSLAHDADTIDHFCGLAATHFSVLAAGLNQSVLTAAIIAMVSSLIAGPWVIAWLKSGVRERIASDSLRLNELHASKQNTPTMGGVLIVAAVVVGAVPLVPLDSPFVWLVLFVMIGLLAVGGYDDWIKARTQRQGLTARRKLAAQTLVATLAAVGLFLLRDQTTSQPDPAESAFRQILASGWFAIPWAVLVIVSTSNAVNLTDGLDGLAAGCTAITGTAMTIIMIGIGIGGAGPASSTTQTAAVFSAALTGSALGFLWYNRHPARVFMGDAGSLPIGGLLAITSLACRIELTLPVTGAVFVVETLSVILQVFWYRRTRRRILLCSPLHNHFAFRGIREPRIVAGFWIAAAVCSAIGVLLSL